MTKAILPTSVYLFLFSILGLVYACGLFVPLMDNDSAHHANIALRMYLTGDYVTLADHNGDYLDKPHLHFWLAAISYELFGVTGFAYKVPSFLFTILGTWSVYRLGQTLYNKETGKLAALIISSAFAYMLANNDVRMDAILTACVAFATWQLVDFIRYRKAINVVGAALGLAMGFCTKGHIAIFPPALAALFYLIFTKDWRVLIHPKFLLMIVLFFVFISPVVYCYYLQFDLHPEKIIRGKSNVSGVKFILWGQSIERFGGESFGSDAKNDYFFFLHSFLWAFAPWSVICFIALFHRLKNINSVKQEWVTAGTLLIMALVITFSGFKLPHYLNIIFPASAVLVAACIAGRAGSQRWSGIFFTIQVVVVCLLLALAALLNAWAFPVSGIILIGLSILLLAIVFYFLKSTFFSRIQKAVTISVAAMGLLFFLLNTNFYPSLLKYQAGNELAFTLKGRINPDETYFWKDVYSSSFNFYTASLRKPFHDSVMNNKKSVWLVTTEDNLSQLNAYKRGRQYAHPDFEITRLTLPFINPQTRASECGKMYIIEIHK